MNPERARMNLDDAVSVDPLGLIAELEGDVAHLGRGPERPPAPAVEEKRPAEKPGGTEPRNLSAGDGSSLLDYAYLLRHQLRKGEVGSVASTPRATRSRRPLAPWPKEIEEGGRRVAALLLAERRRTGKGTALFVAPSPRQGTTTIVRSTAEVLARAGHKVLLVDADIWKERPGDRYGVGVEMGLTDVQFGRCSWQEAVRDTQIPSLKYLPPGLLRRGEEISDLRLQELLAEWSRAFAFVLIDAPAALTRPIAHLWAPLVRAAVVVVAARRTRRHALSQVLDELRKQSCSVLCVVLNRRDYPVPDWLYRLL